MTRLTQAVINTAALQHNLDRVRALCAGGQKVLAMVKADAYGHGIAMVAPAITPDAFGVCSIDEALRCRQLRPSARIVIVNGIWHAADLREAVANGFEWVVHDAHQLALLQACQPAHQSTIWLKINTGMNRLGFAPAAYAAAMKAVTDLPGVKIAAIMTHFSSADDPDSTATPSQLALFRELTEGAPWPRSAANSAAIVAWPETHFDWVRPGIMLYGISPLAGVSAEQLGLRPVMTLLSEIISVRTCEEGERVGYGGTFVCPKPMRVGVVAIGYGDGYPRSNASVMIDGHLVPVIGRVSMDMITVDLTTLPAAGIGTRVVLWGDGLPVERVADDTGRFSYELVCHLTPRVQRVLAP